MRNLLADKICASIFTKDEQSVFLGMKTLLKINSEQDTKIKS
jgi:hypothetical protein